MTRWLEEARRDIGTREFAGLANNPKIMGWGNRLGARVLGIAYTADSIPWCGLGMAHWVDQAGIKPPPIAIRAKSWATWGDPLPLTGHPPIGAIAVFSRKGGGHVGIVTGVYTNGDLDILGANQSDAVNVRRFPRNPTRSRPDLRLIALRWPSGHPIAGPAPLATVASAATTGEG